MIWLGFALASAAGGVSRFWLERNAVHRFGERWPWGTMAANWLGSALLGYIWFHSENADLRVLTAAYCGALTTFGGFIGQVGQRLRHRDTRTLAVAYLAASALGSFALAWFAAVI